MDKFNEIKTRNELASFIDIEPKRLAYILYIKKTENCYTVFKIPKRNGGVRTIKAPNKSLKYIQRHLARKLQEYQLDIWKENNIHPNISHGFEKGKSIITNAKIHRNKKFVLNLDLENFFDSFHFGRIRGFFIKNKYFKLPTEVATVIAQLTCFKGRLPQGAPTSPVITNLICKILDMCLLKIAKSYKLDYTRYADDLTFSTNDKLFLQRKDEFFQKLKNEIELSGFKINDKKTRLQYKDSRQLVTGLVVNEKINVPREYYKDTRAMAHSLYTKGEFTINGVPGTIDQLEGRFAYIDHIMESSNNVNKTELNSKEKEYRRFLFYRYFFANEMPLIITEGKTDSRYIKAALKNLYTRYPLLIKKKNETEFEFQINFLKRTDRIEKLFGVTKDGGDSLKEIYRYYNDKKGDFNQFKFFNKLKQKPATPVIILLDNEMENKKPLGKFLGACNLSNKKDIVKEKLFLNLEANVGRGEKINSNLFLMTIPLVEGKDECEIEDLLPSEILKQKIDGKDFDRTGKKDNKEYYGKDKLSEKVLIQYKKIDFSKFVKLLDTINYIVELYSKNI